MGTAICAVCYENCRGRCIKCGARLCAKCKPKSNRAKCLVCPKTATLTPARQPVVARSRRTPGPARRASPNNVYYVPAPAYTPPRKRLEDMDTLEACQHLEDLHRRLQAKQARERAYLDRRAARGTHTPTDDAYEADQILEDELLSLITHVLKEAQP